MSAHALLKITRDLFRNVIGSDAKMPVEMRKIMAVFLTVIALWFSCHSKRSKNIWVKVLSGMFSLENVAPW